MAETVRFYWLRGDAALPLSAIPEGDRNPLRVRRSVAQQHVPEAVKQLESGRFVAEGWEADRAIRLVLCHPNLAKGPADTILLDTRALPRVVLTLGKWEETSEVVRLFLRAFGSEAASVDDCAAARRELMKWLADHGQPEMAATVKHFQTFPFGVRSDALEVIKIWRRWLVKGQKRQIDKFLDKVSQRFEALGWSRDPTYEGHLNHNPAQVNRFFCWISGPKDLPHVLLCLNRATDRRVRGGTYSHDEKAVVADLASEIQRVLAEVLEPAAGEAGLEVSYPRLGPISRVGPTTTEAMTALAEFAEGQFPLPEEAESFWRKFVQTAYRDEVAISPEELTAWFLASGWNEKAAHELTKRFYNEMALIGEYEEAGRQPA